MIIEDSTRNSAHKRLKQTKPRENGDYQTTGEEKNKESENSIDSAAHNQILKQQKQLSGRNHHTLISINTECQRTQLLHQKTAFGKLD
jgi:hypothetical protein